MVVLLGFTALAVDGSMVYSDRRYAQNAADASSLAAGSTTAQRLEAGNVTYFNWTASPPDCSGHVQNAATAGMTAGRQRATDNGFTVDTDISDHHGLSVSCGQENVTAPLVGGGTATIFVDKFVDLRAEITDETQTAFAHFVFSNALRNTVAAVTRIRPRSPLAFGYAIVALNPETCSGNSNGNQFHGLGGNTNHLLVNGGGVWSNGCMDIDGNPNVEIVDAGAYYFYTANNNDLDDIRLTGDGPDSAQQMVDNNAYRIPPSAYDIPMPDCSGRQWTSNQITNYYDDHHVASDPQSGYLPAGLYCITDQFRVNNNEKVYAQGVTFVLYNGASINGGADVRLMTTLVDSGTGAIPGLVIYQPPTSTADITWNGSGSTILRGTVLAPRATITFLGDSVSHEIMSQIIGWNVEVGGSGENEVFYNASKQVTLPAKLELNR
jgi:hypothetical protein